MRSLEVNEIDKIEEPYLIDVRSRMEQFFGMIDYAISMPMDTIVGNVDKLPKDKTIYIICRSGNRSGDVGRYLDKLGFDTVNLEGGMEAYMGPNVKSQVF